VGSNGSDKSFAMRPSTIKGAPKHRPTPCIEGSFYVKRDVKAWPRKIEASQCRHVFSGFSRQGLRG
jgi:hypothetical protein